MCRPFIDHRHGQVAAAYVKQASTAPCLVDKLRRRRHRLARSSRSAAMSSSARLNENTRDRQLGRQSRSWRIANCVRSVGPGACGGAGETQDRLRWLRDIHAEVDIGDRFDRGVSCSSRLDAAGSLKGVEQTSENSRRGICTAHRPANTSRNSRPRSRIRSCLISTGAVVLAERIRSWNDWSIAGVMGAP